MNECSINTPYVFIITPGTINGRKEFVQPISANVINNGSIVTCPGIINVAMNMPKMNPEPLNLIFANANAASEEVNSDPTVTVTAMSNEFPYALHIKPSPYASTSL